MHVPPLGEAVPEVLPPPLAHVTRRQQLLPFAVSIALLAWLVWSISPEELVAAARQLPWGLLLPATGLMVVGLYLCDAVCLQTLFATAQRRVGWRDALHVRGTSYLAGAIHYGLGHAAVAWGMARAQGTPLSSALSRSIVLAWHDVVVLLALGLGGSLLATSVVAGRVQVFCMVGLALVGAAAVIIALLPASARSKLERRRLWLWLQDWDWKRSVRLAGLRVGYFAILLVYAAVALAICDIPVGPFDVLSSIPLVLLADGLPSISGLGTRETALQLLLRPQRPEVLLALSLIWSTGLLCGRLLIGLAHLWVPRIAAVRRARIEPRDGTSSGSR